MGFRRRETDIQGLYIIEPDVFGDSRGFFMELYNQNAFKKLGLNSLDFVQDNLSSSAKGTIRGLHFQAPPHKQAKLVTVIQGSVLDVAVDIRKQSPTYGKSFSIEISAEKPALILIPEGCAHGFQVLTDNCFFFYKCTGVYNRESEGGLFWKDPELNIAWKNLDPIVSEKDKAQPLLKDFDSPFD